MNSRFSLKMKMELMCSMHQKMVVSTVRQSYGGILSLINLTGKKACIKEKLSRKKD